MENVTGTIIRWTVSILMFCLVIGALFWFIKNPTTAAGFIVGSVGGIYHFATGLINGIAGLFA